LKNPPARVRALRIAPIFGSRGVAKLVRSAAACGEMGTRNHQACAWLPAIFPKIDCNVAYAGSQQSLAAIDGNMRLTRGSEGFPIPTSPTPRTRKALWPRCPPGYSPLRGCALACALPSGLSNSRAALANFFTGSKAFARIQPIWQSLPGLPPNSRHSGSPPCPSGPAEQASENPRFQISQPAPGSAFSGSHFAP
jgi:hypothetical protein